MRQFPARFPSRRRQSPLSPFGRTGGTVGEKFCSCFVPNARLGSMAYVESAYRGVVMTRVMLRIALLALLLTPRAAAAQDLRQNAPGQFDFYVLSLSWSPSFCAEAAERGTRSATANVQCGPRPYSLDRKSTRLNSSHL